MKKVDLARELIEKMPNAPALTLARALRKRHSQVFHSVENARDAVRRVLGLKGAKQLKVTKNPIVRAPRKAGEAASFPPTCAEPWEPISLPTPCCALSLSDLHVPYHDQRAIETAVRYAKRRHKITDLIVNGDYADFYTISRFIKDPRKRSLKDELDTQRQGLVWLAKKFPNARLWFKLGNHDNRWDIWVWQHAPEIADLEHVQLHNVLGFANLGFRRVDDQPIMVGKLPVLHGHELNGGTSPVSPARGAFNKTHHTVLVGHWHRTSASAQSNMWHDETMVWSQGCLCELSPAYGRINQFNLGFAVIDAAKDGTFDVHNYRIGADYAVRAS